MGSPKSSLQPRGKLPASQDSPQGAPLTETGAEGQRPAPRLCSGVSHTSRLWLPLPSSQQVTVPWEAWGRKEKGSQPLVIPPVPLPQTTTNKHILQKLQCVPSWPFSHQLPPKPGLSRGPSRLLLPPPPPHRQIPAHVACAQVFLSAPPSGVLRALGLSRALLMSVSQQNSAQHPQPIPTPTLRGRQ